MALPRIFVSSTYFDLKHIRKNLEIFIETFGYEPVLFESGDIPFHHDIPLDISCYKEIENAHMQILVIGGRYGSPNSDLDEEELKNVDEDKMYSFYNSITKKEYEKAVEKGIPVFIFVDKGVLSEYETYKKNRDNKTIKYAHVDSINVFKLLDDVLSKKTGNYVKAFEHIDDITSWLKLQWAGIFADFLSKNTAEIELKNLSSQVGELSVLTNSLKEYTEAIMKQIKPKDYQKIIKKEEDRISNVMAQRLYEAPMIRHLRDDFKLANTPLELLNILKKCKTIETFISSLDMPQSLKDNFLSDFKTPGEVELLRYRKQFLTP